MRRGAFTIVAECFGMAHSTVHCLWNRVVCMCASRISFSPKKIRETAYVSINQGHPIMEAADSKKAGNVIGGVKDDGAF